MIDLRTINLAPNSQADQPNMWVDSQQDQHEEEQCRPTTTGDWQAVGVAWALIGQLVGVQNPHNITTGHTDRMIDLRTINLAPN